MRRAIGAVTIGQSPRGDLTPGLRAFLGSEIPILETGALDDLTREEVEAIAPVTTGPPFLTRLRDGTTVMIGEDFLLPRIQACVDRLQEDTDLILLLCTGSFPAFASRRPILYPDRVLEGLVAGVGVQRLGVLTPTYEQVDFQRERWGRLAPEVTVEVASPYRSPELLLEPAERFAASATDVVVLDCIGYTGATRSIMRERTGKPVLLAISALARAAAELVL